MITILTGANSYALQAELRKLTRAFIEEQGDDMALERLDGEEASYERMQEALQSLPFLAARKLVVLLTPSSNKQFLEKAETLLAELPETTDLIIVEPKLDKRTAYYKLLKKQKGFREFPELDENGLARWLASEAKTLGATLGMPDARYLVERAGANQQYLAHEVEKLALGATAISTDKPAISRQLIDDLTTATPSSTIFQLLEAAFAGNTRRTLELYGEQRALKVEPQQIIAMLAWQLHVLALIKAASLAQGDGPSPDVIAKEAKLNPFVVKKTAGIARSLTMGRLRTLVKGLTTIDERLKRESLNADDVLQAYLVDLSRAD